MSFSFCFSQNDSLYFLKSADTLNRIKLNTVIVTEATMSSTALIGLNQLWYADYPRSNFHFINDNDQWMQMDKVGHLFSSYHLGSFGASAMNWSGTSKKSQLVYGATIGFAFLTAVEVFDGFSSEWGASLGDVLANASGTALYVSQELAWKEQRIIPKFSFHTTHYASIRPSVFGSSITEQVLKDYNGQTYWFSINMYSFFKHSKIPKWLNLALGYGADGMLSGNNRDSASFLIQNGKSTRQFYLSFDVDLTKIETKSHFLKTIFTVFNTIKIPAPTFEISSSATTKFHPLYF